LDSGLRIFKLSCCRVFILFHYRPVTGSLVWCRSSPSQTVPSPLKPKDWATIHNLVLKCAAMPEGTNFWASHSALKQLKAGTSSYIKQYEHRMKQLEKTPQTEIPGRGNLVVGNPRTWKPGCGSQRIDPPMGSAEITYGQETPATNAVLPFDTEALKTYKELGKHFSKNCENIKSKDAAVSRRCRRHRGTTKATVQYKVTTKRAPPCPAQCFRQPMKPIWPSSGASRTYPWSTKTPYSAELAF
jgi:hypothetical protein